MPRVTAAGRVVLQGSPANPQPRSHKRGRLARARGGAGDTLGAGEPLSLQDGLASPVPSCARGTPAAAGQASWRRACAHSRRPCKGRRLPMRSPWGWPGWGSPPPFPCVNLKDREVNRGLSTVQSQLLWGPEAERIRKEGARARVGVRCGGVCQLEGRCLSEV